MLEIHASIVGERALCFHYVQGGAHTSSLTRDEAQQRYTEIMGTGTEEAVQLAAALVRTQQLAADLVPVADRIPEPDPEPTP